MQKEPEASPALKRAPEPIFDDSQYAPPKSGIHYGASQEGRGTVEKRDLGKTGIAVSRLGLGGLFTSKYGGTLDQSIRTIKRAVERGITYIDTAPAYFDSEVVIGKALRDNDFPLVMSTKLGGRPQKFDPRNATALRESVYESMENLGCDHIDILFIHEPDRPGQYDWWDGENDYNGPVLDVLTELKREGIITASGLGGTTAYKLTRLVETGKFDVVLMAINYTVLWREHEIDLLPTAAEKGVAVIAGSPLQNGALAKRYDSELENGVHWMAPPRRAQFRAFYAYLDEIDIDIVELAHRFLLSHPAIDCILSGARSPAEIDANVASIEKGPLPDEVLARLNEIAAMVPFRPHDEPAILPFGRPYKGPGQLI